MMTIYIPPNPKHIPVLTTVCATRLSDLFQLLCLNCTITSTHSNMYKKFLLVVYCFSFLLCCVLSTSPSVESVDYQIKTANLLGTTLEVGVVSVSVDQDLYRLDSAACPPYSCQTETIGCLCDYTHGAVGGCGSSTDSSCQCDVEEFCDESVVEPWSDLQEGVPVPFSGANYQYYRFFLDQCKAVRVRFFFLTLFFFPVESSQH